MLCHKKLIFNSFQGAVSWQCVVRFDFDFNQSVFFLAEILSVGYTSIYFCMGLKSLGSMHNTK